MREIDTRMLIDTETYHPIDTIDTTLTVPCSPLPGETTPHSTAAERQRLNLWPAVDINSTGEEFLQRFHFSSIDVFMLSASQ